jgi:hypothetical protein
VDKTLKELSTFAALVAESKKMGQEWKIVFVAALAGKMARYQVVKKRRLLWI